MNEKQIKDNFKTFQKVKTEFNILVVNFFEKNKITSAVSKALLYDLLSKINFKDNLDLLAVEDEMSKIK